MFGFVLPNDRDGLSKKDTFIANLFAIIEINFKTADVSNNAYLYVV